MESVRLPAPDRLAVQLAVLASLVLGAWVGCSDPLRDGVYSCTREGRGTDCPPRWYCRAPEMLCYRTAVDGRADGGMDAGGTTMCGNGVLDDGEECDDRNDVRSDGCADCRVLPAAIAQSVRLLVGESAGELLPGGWCDLDGDGAGDNAFAVLGDQRILDDTFPSDLARATVFMGLVLDPTERGASLVEGTEVGISALTLVDANDDLSDNFTGRGEHFSLHAGQTPTVSTLGPRGLFRAASDVVVFELPDANAALLTISPAFVEAEVAWDDRVVGVRGTLCGALAVAPLVNTGPVNGHPSLAHYLIEGVLAGPGTVEVVPDHDPDGNGLATLEVIDGVLTFCHGDAGALEGRDCIEDYRFQDAFSFFAAFNAVGARVLGEMPAP